MDEDWPTLQAIAAGREDALVKLMDRYRQSIFRLAYRFAGNPSDAQELTEDVFTRIFFEAKRYRPKATVRQWIFTIAANRCRDFLRHRQRHPRTEQILESESAGAADPSADAADAVESRELAREIADAIASLPEKLRLPFVLCLLEDHSQEDAAAILGISRKAVETRIYRARRHLQALLSPPPSR
jgi:RNA polymerase sigma-70 factor (ECF subfamily)